MSDVPAYLRLGLYSSFTKYTRYLFTLRSVSQPSKYHTLLLFRLSPKECRSDLQPPVSQSDQLFVMESSCPHLGADLSHAEIEEWGDESMVAVCPWHRYDFDLRTGKSETGLRACTYSVKVLDSDTSGTAQIWVESPGEGGWDIVEIRPVSEDFADPPSAISRNPVENSNITSSSSVAISEEAEPTTLFEWAVLILNTPNPELKVKRTRDAVLAFRTGKLRSVGRGVKNKPVPPDVPPREKDLNFVAPGKVTRRGNGGSLKSRIIILHALANIEQWAWDIIARFGDEKVAGQALPHQFFSDWVKVAEDESKHFSLLRRRLQELGSFYGEHTVHAGLWESARDTAHSLPARLCIIHLVHEARGLDVNPTTIAKFRAAGDQESVRVLEIIHHDEITHVTAGHRWFTWICEALALDPIHEFRENVRKYFNGLIRGPFNESDRRLAGMTPDYYLDLRGEGGVLDHKKEGPVTYNI
ncbi:uncharacterized protein EI90DRAFT_3145887 [Cantharellus anzutake]|uniref:uncharacterized protein n=1 Tax=Cantharellus anzutake TaxID=1750568 RepID=UPI0019073CB4|nr:uncharacterized protein EI90DRAFT_3145887 [Cantharellus anzutake]KAF8329833.1 hypothetical protein EI90DRAFT_3145887 [Cantharellus anzutake]